MFGLGLGSVIRLVAPTVASVAFRSVKDLIQGGSSKVDDLVTRGLITPEDDLVDEDIQVIEDDNVSDELTKILIEMVPSSLRSNLDDGSKDTNKTVKAVLPYLRRLVYVLEHIEVVSNQVDSAIPDKE